MIKDVSKMSDGQLLRELVRRIVRYDKARDHYVGFLQKQLDKKASEEPVKDEPKTLKELDAG